LEEILTVQLEESQRLRPMQWMVEQLKSAIGLDHSEASESDLHSTVNDSNCLLYLLHRSGSEDSTRSIKLKLFESTTEEDIR
jgi:hypothetical protein